MKAVFLIWCATAIAFASSAGVGGAPSQERFKTSVDLARFDLAVERDDRAVTGLVVDDFEVTEGGRSIAGVAVTELRDVPFDMVLVLQPFASHAGDQIPLFDRAARGVFDGIRPSDRFGVVMAGKPPVRVRALQPGAVRFDPDALAGTRHVVLLDAIASAFGEFEAAERRQILLTLADGVDRLSALDGEMLAPFAARARPQVVFLGASPTLDAGFKTYVVEHDGRAGLERQYSERVFKNTFPGDALRQVAETTGGRIVDLRSGDPERLVADLLARLRSGYVLTFPASPVKGWHGVSIKVKKRGARVTTRAGYSVD